MNLKYSFKSTWNGVTYALLISLIISSCKKPNGESAETNHKHSTIQLKYAEGFTVQYLNGAKLVEVAYPYQGASSGYKYLLVERGKPLPSHDEDTKIITIPLESIACTSTTHIPLLDYLNESDKLTGFPTLDYISSEKMRKRIDAGEVSELGIDKGMNLEQIAVLQPDLLMGYTMSGDYSQFRKIETLGVPVVMNAEYLEKHPLGRAEWIKFMALFFNKEKVADSVFNEIEKSYLDTRSLTETVSQKPTVLSGIVYGDAWFLPGGENYAAKLLKDAGCKYLWEEDPSHGYLELSFESVYEKAHHADLWIGVGSFSSLTEIKNADERYTKFKPFSTQQVYTYDARKGSKGGSEFLELGYLRPDIILQDLVKIAHPQLLPGYKLYFHRKLN